MATASSRTMEKLQNDCVSEEEAMSDTDKCRVENDVLRMEMSFMTRDHEAEKNKIMKDKDNAIDELNINNEELNMKIGDQADKMQEMEKARLRNDKEMESLIKRADKLLQQKIKLEKELKHAKERYEKSTMDHAQQGKMIRKLETELSEVKEELKEIRKAKEEQVHSLDAYFKDADEKQERREEHLHKMMQKQHAEMLCQIKAMDIRSKPPAVKDTKLKITEVQNVQITFDAQNGRNNAAFNRRTALNNRPTFKPLKGNNNLPK